MATSTCRRCIHALPIRNIPTRPSFTTPALRITSAAAFSTSAPHAATNQKPGVRSAVKGTRTLRLSKNKRADRKGKAPAPGERKAIRKRIVLSNTNAFEVQGLNDYSAKNIADEEVLGTMVGLPETVIDALRAIEAFKPTQGWGFFSRPATLVRAETMEIARHIESGEAKTMRKMIVGERGVGKSVLLLQAQTMAFLKDWVVVHIPEAQDLTIGHTAYAPLEGSKPVQYIQKTYTADLLARIVKANEPILSTLTLSLDHNLPIATSPDLSLARLADLGARDPEVAWPIFQALWAELTLASTAGSPRPKILLSLDGLAFASRLSEYLAPSMHFIHAHDLLLIDHFMRYLSGAATLPNGGIVIAADSASNRPINPSLELAVRQSGAAGGPEAAAGLPLHDVKSPYERVDERVVRCLRTAGVMALKGFDREEARTVLEYYAKSGMLRKTVTEALVTEKWTLSGGGLIGELERGTVKAASL